MITDHNATLPGGFLHTADQAAVRVDGQELRVVRYRQFDVPLYFVHASLPEGTHEVEVSIRRHKTQVAVHPKRLGLEVDPGGRKQPVRFTIRGNPHLAVECDGLGYLFLSFDPAQQPPTGDTVLDAAAYGLESNADAIQTKTLQTAIDRVSASDKLDILLIPAGLYRVGDLHLKSNCRLHLASGAVLKASDKAADFKELNTRGSDGTRHCLINGRDAENVALTGHGHVDGNRAVLDLDRYFNGMVKLDRCRNVTFDGIVLSDSCGWNTHFYACTDVLAHRVKILNNRPLVNCINTDGINPNACRNVRIENCLMHTGDDAVAVKSCTWRRDMHPGHEQMLQDVSNITVSDLLAVNNSTTVKIGTETDAAIMENITFERIDAVRTGRLCGIDAFDKSLVRNVRFEDCHVHHLDDAMMDRRLIDLNVPAKAFRKIIGKSRVENVTLRNISSDEPARVALAGRDADCMVENAVFENITINGNPLEESTIEKNEFVQSTKFRS
ncbi:MAG: glycoside hydrolase family 28 protein [Oceanipulchritudo sp.]